MKKCISCDNKDEELFQCEECEDWFCYDCLAQASSHDLIERDICQSCYDFTREELAKSYYREEKEIKQRKETAEKKRIEMNRKKRIKYNSPEAKTKREKKKQERLKKEKELKAQQAATLSKIMTNIFRR